MIYLVMTCLLYTYVKLVIELKLLYTVICNLYNVTQWKTCNLTELSRKEKKTKKKRCI